MSLVDFEGIWRELSPLRWRKRGHANPPFGGWPIRTTAPRDAW